MARPKGMKNNPADISTGYIIKKIAQSTDLTQTQITESVNLYTSFIENYLKSSICPEDVKIQIPNLGKFSFKKKLGMKAGSTYKKPYTESNNFGVLKDENGKGMMETIYITEDQPDYLRVWFEISPTLQKEVREVSENKWCKQHGKK